MVQQRRAFHRTLLRRTHSPAIPSHRQHTRGKQGSPPLHLQIILLPPRPRRAEYIILRLRHPHLPVAATPQLPRPPTACCPTRQRRLLQTAQITLRQQPAGSAVGRRSSADRRDVLLYQDPEPEQPNVRHDEQHADGWQQSFCREEERAEDCRQLGPAFCAGVGLSVFAC